jgi:SAM-dependent methyltransferase
LESLSKVHASSISALVTNAAVCEICDGRVGTIHLVREMMLGLREVFQYFECRDCGCLQLLDPPADPSRYYPANYTAFRDADRSASILQRMRRYLRRGRNRAVFGSTSPINKWAARHFQHPPLQAVARLRPRLVTRILDVGCGSGVLLNDLRQLGYEHLLGVDLFIPQPTVTSAGVRIQKGGLESLAGTTWDIVMFHHSFEHMPDPVRIMRLAESLLAPGGHCLVRIPVLGWAWQHYGTDWVQLDAPRHLFLHTERSFEVLASKCGLRFQTVTYDSTELQFLGSELYKKDLPLCSINMNKPSSSVPPSTFRDHQVRAAILNRENRGDSAAFDLVRS